MFKNILKNATTTAMTLTIFAAVFTLCMASVYLYTKAPILKSEQMARMSLFRQIVDESLYNNQLLNDSIELAPDALLGHRQPTKAQIARINGKATAVILEAVAHDGYSGDIKLLIAIKTNGQLAGVRVIAHSETPGLGDYIDIAKDHWITGFANLSLSQPSLAQWKVKKDGGQFDYRVGATITPRAVVSAVAKALQYVEQHQANLFGHSKQSNQQTN